MKRFLVIPLLTVYLIAASGILINLHYCGEQLEAWDVYADKAGCAGDECGDESEDNDGCCKDEIVLAKIDQEQDTPQSYIFKLLSIGGDSPAVLPALEFEIGYDHQSVGVQQQPNAPPGLWQSIPLYKLYTQYTYYG